MSLWEDDKNIEAEELDNFDTTFCFKIKEKLEKAPKFRRNSKEKLDSLIKIAEETQVLGEDPIKYWNRNKILAHLDIKNVDYNIKTAKGDHTPLDVEEFGKQIKELLDLKVIRKSSSRHRSTAFLVRNHAEIKRGKARMVINYKRLNDNTHIDSYDISSKDMLINCIQAANIFSKFDCKLGFWQILLDEESKPWTAFTCPEGHFEWNVMPF